MSIREGRGGDMLFRCKNCGGNVVYSPDMGKMHCPHCDGIDSEKADEAGAKRSASTAGPL